MTNESELAARIVRRLDNSLDGIDPRALAQLRSARMAALERMRVEPALAFALAGPGGVGTSWAPGGFNLRSLLPIAGLLIALCGMVYWQQDRFEDPVELDARLLSSDLPIDALVDTRLDSWLQR